MSSLMPRLLKFMSIELMMIINHLILCHPLLALSSILPSNRVFSKESCLSSGGQNFGFSASTTVLSMNIQGSFPLGLTDLISLQSKQFSRVFSSTTTLKHNSSVLNHFYGPAPTSVHDYWKNHSFDFTDLCQQRDASAF